MMVVISQRPLSLTEGLSKELNKLTRNFNNQKYSKIENIDSLLLERDISIEEKKKILIEKLHGGIVETFSIDKNKFNKKSFDSLKKRLHNLRKLIIKLRSINYYLETTFLENLRHSKLKIKNKGSKLKWQSNLARNELEALEYAAYKLIERVVMLDKRLLSEYSHREKKISGKEKVEIKDLDLILRKESELLEHLEAKLPPPKAVTFALTKEPIFTHWVARMFALLSYLEHIYAREVAVFSKLKKNKTTKVKISKKISHLMKERSKLLKILEEKAVSMKKFRIDNELKKEVHNLTTTLNL